LNHKKTEKANRLSLGIPIIVDINLLELSFRVLGREAMLLADTDDLLFGDGVSGVGSLAG
jgi:hypothetical protein